MIQIQYMKPFYKKVRGSKMHLVFAYQYFSVMKDDEAFHFIPIESKEIIIDLNTMQVQNLSDVFVFQRGNRFMRLPLYQLLLVSNIHDHLHMLIEDVNGEVQATEAFKTEESVSSQTMTLLNELELMHLRQCIDNALDGGDKELFTDLSIRLAKAMEAVNE